MPAYAQSNMALIQATLSHDYGLEPTEVEILTEDVVNNLKALWQTIVNHGAPLGVGHFDDALTALRAFAEKLRQERLIEFADILAEHRDERKSAPYRDALAALKQYLDGLEAAVAESQQRRQQEFGVRNGPRSKNKNHDVGRSR